MTREFLHEVVKRREDPWQVPRPRVSMSAHDFITRGAPMPYVDGSRVISSIPIAPMGLAELQPAHIEIPARARTATAMVMPRGSSDRLLAFEFVVIHDQRDYRRTNTVIGDIPTELINDTRSARMLRMHAYALVENHGCYPDYNVTNTTYRDEQLFAISYGCASCGRRFSGVE